MAGRADCRGCRASRGGFGGQPAAVCRRSRAARWRRRVYHVSGLPWRHGHGLPRDRVPEANVGRPVFSACAAAALYRRADWINAGGLDERFFCYAEDVDLGFRLQLLGRQCWYEPGAVALHVGGAASGKSSAFAVYHGHRNLEWAFLKNMPSSLLRRYFRSTFSSRLVRSVVRGARAGRDDCASQVGRLATAAGGACYPARGASHEKRFGRAVAGRAQSGGVDTADLAARARLMADAGRASAHDAVVVER